MSKFTDLIASFAPDAADFNVEDFRAAVTEAYNEDISVRDSAVQARDSSLAEAQAEINKWKLKNYDLLQQIPADPQKVKAPGAPTTPEEEAEANTSVSDLFGKKE